MIARLRVISYDTFHIITLLVLAGIPYIYWASGNSYAAELTDRSVSISTASPSASASDLIKATVGSVNPVGSIEFQYCSNSPIITETCIAPNGLSVSNATLVAQTGNTGFSINTAYSNINTIVLSRTAVPALAVASSYNFSNIINPSTANLTTFIRITTYQSNNAAGTYIDDGAVAFSTTPNLTVGAYVPPFLAECVAVIVASNCSSTKGNNLNMGLLSSQTTGTASSQLAASTNSVNGYAVYVLGQTMVSGNNVITANSSPSPSIKGENQFGINLTQNSNPNVGSNPTGFGTAIPSPGYNQPNNFTFVPGSEIANSPTSTQFNILTISYVANVNKSDQPGIYATTLTYLASTQF